MIRDDFEFKRTLARITEYHLQLVELRERLKRAGHSEEQIEHKMRGLKAGVRALEDDVATYERCSAQTWVPDH